MEKEYSLLTEICRHGIFAEEFTVPVDTEWKLLFKLAKAHNLTALFHCAFTKVKNRAYVPTEFLKALENSFLDIVFLSQRQEQCAGEARKLLSENKIKSIAFKGVVLKRLYPVPESRAMGDTDIIISPDDRSTVKKLLTQNGFTCTAENGPVYCYEKYGALLEVHTVLINDYPTESFSKPFEFAHFNGCCGEFDDDFHFAYLIAHTAHHFKFYGAGIKLVADLAVMLASKSIDINKVFEYLAEARLDDFARVLLSVCFEWFGKGQSYTTNTLKTKEFLLKNGVFGNANENKGVTVARRELENGKSYSPFMMKLRLAFPSYNRLKSIDYIKFIDGRPWLTPYAWVYRFVYNIKNKKEFMTNAISSLDDENTKTQAYEQLEFFREIGLK